MGAVVCQYKVCRKRWAGLSGQKTSGVIKNLVARRAPLICGFMSTGKAVFVRTPHGKPDFLFSVKALIYRASVTNNGDINETSCVVDGINYSIITDSNSPEKILPHKLLAPDRSWIFRKGLNFFEYSQCNCLGKTFKFFACRTGKGDRIGKITACHCQ